MDKRKSESMVVIKKVIYVIIVAWSAKRANSHFAICSLLTPTHIIF